MILWCGEKVAHGHHRDCPGYPSPETMPTDEQWLGVIRTLEDEPALDYVRGLRESAEEGHRAFIGNWEPRLRAHDDLQRMLWGISDWLDTSYPDGLDGEAHLRRRIDKVAAEAGEVLDALADYIGENPRKGICGTREDVEYELLDVATAALGALMHMRGGYDVVAALSGHVRAVYERAGLDWADLTVEQRVERAQAALEAAHATSTAAMKRNAHKIMAATQRLNEAKIAAAEDES